LTPYCTRWWLVSAGVSSNPAGITQLLAQRGVLAGGGDPEPLLR